MFYRCQINLLITEHILRLHEETQSRTTILIYCVLLMDFDLIVDVTNYTRTRALMETQRLENVRARL